MMIVRRGARVRVPDGDRSFGTVWYVYPRHVVVRLDRGDSVVVEPHRLIAGPPEPFFGAVRVLRREVRQRPWLVPVAVIVGVCMILQCVAGVVGA